ncbi:MAG: endonuclease III [Anaerolineae bacterium]|nr:endonuclease III [Anaerolineae bacterium]MDW8102687.1 endonuclease III [Anaerolineae bacterium]
MEEKIREIHRRLLTQYGDKGGSKGWDPVTLLVSAILSQNTNDALRDRAFERLRARFSSWEEVRDAPVEEVEEAIRVAGLSRQKAFRIQQALRRITNEVGTLDLSFLRKMDLEEARKWLMSMEGIGPKTAAIILLFGLGMAAFPVDTHIFRVSKRLGLISQRTTREKAHKILESLIPPEHYYSFHLNMIEHGRKVCSPRHPRCQDCVLNDLCDFYRGSA